MRNESCGLLDESIIVEEGDAEEDVLVVVKGVENRLEEEEEVVCPVARANAFWADRFQ